MLRSLWRRFGPNPLQTMLRQAQQKQCRRILIPWNRGMGDIPLGLYGLNVAILEKLPYAQITYLTRQDLLEGFELLGNVEILPHPSWKRYEPFDLNEALAYFNLSRTDFDWILEKPDPTHWLIAQRGRLIPRLHWDLAWDALAARFVIDSSRPCVGVHVQTETYYSSFSRNWPLPHWQSLFKKITACGYQVLLFGFSATPPIDMPDVIDVRGQTSLKEMLALTRRYCTHLVLPDSGPLAMNYYLNTQHPLTIVSLWADPHHGVLKQAVPSPNKNLRHIPLHAPIHRDLTSLPVESVFTALNL